MSFSDTRILELYNPSKMSSDGICVFDENFIPEYHHFEKMRLGRQNSRQDHWLQWSASTRRSGKLSVSRKKRSCFWPPDCFFRNGNYGWFCSVLKQSSHQVLQIRHWNTANRWRRSQIVHWINQLQFLDPLHRFRKTLWTSTNLGLEPYLPASKGCWCKELVKMEIRNLQSLLVCPIILRIVSSTEDRSWHRSVTDPRSCQSPFFNLATALLSLFDLDHFVGCVSTWRCANEHFSPKRQPFLFL